MWVVVMIPILKMSKVQWKLVIFLFFVQTGDKTETISITDKMNE